MLPVVYFVFSSFRRSLRRRSMMLREHMSEVSANLAEVINGIKVVKSFGKERTENRNFMEKLKPTFDMSLNLSMRSISLSIVMDQLMVYSLVAVLGFGGYMVSEGEMSVGELVAFYTYMQMFFGPVAALTNFAPAISEGGVSAERLLNLMDAVPEIKEREHSVHLHHADGYVVFDRVGFQYAANRPVLDFLKETLKDKVSDVRISKILKSHPVCMTADGPVSLEMEKYFKRAGNEMMAGMSAQRVLELNPDSAAFAALKRAVESDQELAKKYAELLYCQALLIADLPLEDPSAYTDLVCSLMQ